MKKLKLLISAFSCDPYGGSEPGVGWNFVSNIAKHHECTVITRNNFRKHIDLKKQESPHVFKNLTFIYVKRMRIRFLERIWPPSYYWTYWLWQRKVYRLSQKIIAEKEIDLVHHLNFVCYREPGYLWELPKPFVWGPVGGFHNAPWKLFSELSIYGKIHHLARNTINLIQMHLLKRPKKAAMASQKIIAATPDTQATIKSLWGKDSEVISEVGLVSTVKAQVAERKPGQPLELVWSGLHIPRKALNILIKTLSRLPKDIEWRLNILGSGPMTKKWQKLATSFDLASKCRWYGNISKEEALKVMSKGHLFCITSLHDLTSTVLLEALSYGMPVVCLDHCGFSNVVDDTCGIKIPVTNAARVIQSFADALQTVYNDEEQRKRMAQGAIARAQDFSWEGKIERLDQIYEEILN